MLGGFIVLAILALLILALIREVRRRPDPEAERVHARLVKAEAREAAREEERRRKEEALEAYGDVPF